MSGLDSPEINFSPTATDGGGQIHSDGPKSPYEVVTRREGLYKRISGLRATLATDPDFAIVDSLVRNPYDINHPSPVEITDHTFVFSEVRNRLAIALGEDFGSRTVAERRLMVEQLGFVHPAAVNSTDYGLDPRHCTMKLFDSMMARTGDVDPILVLSRMLDRNPTIFEGLDITTGGQTQPLSEIVSRAGNTTFRTLEENGITITPPPPPFTPSQ